MAKLWLVWAGTNVVMFDASKFFNLAIASCAAVRPLGGAASILSDSLQYVLNCAKYNGVKLFASVML